MEGTFKCQAKYKYRWKCIHNFNYLWCVHWDGIINGKCHCLYAMIKKGFDDTIGVHTIGSRKSKMNG